MLPIGIESILRKKTPPKQSKTMRKNNRYATLPVICREIFSMSTGTELFLLLAQGSFWQNVPRTNDTNNHDKLSNIISLSLLPSYTISNNVMISNLKVKNVTF